MDRIASVTFFIDRSLGRRSVPDGLRKAGWSLIIHDDFFVGRSEVVADTEWLTTAGQHGWAVLMKDSRIRYRSAERASLIAAGIHCFCLTRGDLSGPAMVDAILRWQQEIFAAASTVGPSLHVFSASGFRRIDDVT